MVSMIELKPYHTLHSPDIRALWKEDHFLLTKVAKTAYRILIGNVAIFIHNRTACVRNYFIYKQKAGTDYTRAILSLIEGSMMQALLTRAILGPWNIWNTLPLGDKCDPLLKIVSLPTPPRSSSDVMFMCSSGGTCRIACPCEDLVAWPWINRLKQLELEHFALFSAGIFFTYNIVQAVRAEPKNLPLTKKIANVAKKQFSAPQFIFYASLITLSLVTSRYREALWLGSKYGFDRYGFESSGHFMLKTVLAPIVGATLSQMGRTNPPLAAFGATVYTITDAIFLRNTAHVYHTAAEVIAGYLWGRVIITASDGVAKLSTKVFHHWYNSPNVA